MIVELWSKQIINGKKQFKDVPRLLKPRVKQYLINQGRVELTIQGVDK